MTKKEVQKRVLQNGKPLALRKFTWDEKTNTFSSNEDNLIIDFNIISYCTFNTGSHCIFKTYNYCTFNTENSCTFSTGFDCTFNTGGNCTFDTNSNCTFKTGSNCTFKTGSYCTFDTGSYCIFKTNSDCVFNTGSVCTFKTGGNCTFNCWVTANIINECQYNILVLRDNTNEIYDLDTLEKDKMIYFQANKKPISKEIKEVKLVDNEIVIINSTKQFQDYTIYSAQNIENYFNGNKVFKIVSKEYDGKTYYAHCEHIKKGIEDVNFKIARENYNLSEIAQQIKNKNNTINWYDYRLITGACEFGTKEWLDQNNYTTDDTMNISEFYEKYKEQHPYGFDKFEEFYKEWF